MGEVEVSPAGGERARWRVCLAAIVLAGVAAAACGDDNGSEAGDDGTKSTDDTVAPRVGDHWHAAYGVYVCDSFVGVAENFESPLGIHSHGDELVHIHPFSRQSSGGNATLLAFAQAAPLLNLTEDQVAVGDETYNGGVDTCDGEAVEVALYKWADGEEEAQVFTEGFEDVTFDADREVYTIAAVPPGADVPQPDSVSSLDDLSGGS